MTHTSLRLPLLLGLLAGGAPALAHHDEGNYGFLNRPAEMALADTWYSWDARTQIGDCSTDRAWWGVIAGPQGLQLRPEGTDVVLGPGQTYQHEDGGGARERAKLSLPLPDTAEVYDIDIAWKAWVDCGLFDGGHWGPEVHTRWTLTLRENRWYTGDLHVHTVHSEGGPEAGSTYDYYRRMVNLATDENGRDFSSRRTDSPRGRMHWMIISDHTDRELADCGRDFPVACETNAAMTEGTGRDVSRFWTEASQDAEPVLIVSGSEISNIFGGHFGFIPLNPEPGHPLYAPGWTENCTDYDRFWDDPWPDLEPGEFPTRDDQALGLLDTFTGITLEPTNEMELEIIHEMGAAAFLNHEDVPYLTGWTQYYWDALDFDGIEVWNGSLYHDWYDDSAYNGQLNVNGITNNNRLEATIPEDPLLHSWVGMLKEGRWPMAAVGGSDVHQYDLTICSDIPTNVVESYSQCNVLDSELAVPFTSVWAEDFVWADGGTGVGESLVAGRTVVHDRSNFIDLRLSYDGEEHLIGDTIWGYTPGAPLDLRAFGRVSQFTQGDNRVLLVLGTRVDRDDAQVDVLYNSEDEAHFVEEILNRHEMRYIRPDTNFDRSRGFSLTAQQTSDDYVIWAQFVPYHYPIAGAEKELPDWACALHPILCNDQWPVPIQSMGRDMAKTGAVRISQNLGPRLALLSEADLEVAAALGASAGGVLTFTNAGDTGATWRASSDAPWLEVSPVWGTLAPGEVSDNGLTATCGDDDEVRSGQVTVREASTGQEIRVRLRLTCGEPPGGGGGVIGTAPEPVPGMPPSSSWGDPHLVSWDGLMYDFQAAGEFVFAEDGAGFTLQVRQEPYGSRVAVNTALAAAVAGDRVGFYAGEDPPLWIAGVPTSLTTGELVLPGGGILFSTDDRRFWLKWPTGELLVVTDRGGHLDFNLWPAALDQPGMQGLVGSYNGSPQDDLRLRDGTLLTQPAGFQALYGPYAASWRVGEAESLFDYGEGEGPGAFDVPDFPPGPATTSSLSPEDYAAARAVCEAAGITDPLLLDACILDVALTQDAAFAAGSAQATVPVAALASTYYNTFEAGVGPGWSDARTAVSPGTAAHPATTFLGPFAEDEEVHLSFEQLPAHDAVAVTVDLFVMLSWDGTGAYGPDLWSFGIAGDVFTTSFQAYVEGDTSFQQSYPEAYPQSGWPGGSAARELNTLGYLWYGQPMDAVYRISRQVPHTGDTLTIDFASLGLSHAEDEAWGLDNVSVELVTGEVGDVCTGPHTREDCPQGRTWGARPRVGRAAR